MQKRFTGTTLTILTATLLCVLRGKRYRVITGVIKAMRIFKVKKDGASYKVYEATRGINGLIINWRFVGDTIYFFKAYEFIRQNGREFNPATDRVMKTWDGIGTYMKRV
jgi:hypothetical protein